MKLLILTQKIDENDDVLGFMHGWVKEFARRCDEVTVICLERREHRLPKNTRVLSLGKEEGRSRLKYLWNFYRYIISERRRYDAVFVHMNHEYVLLGGVIWRMFGKKVALWYAHGHAPLSLRVAERLSHLVFASTRSGFRLQSEKLKVIGQGIDTEAFPFTERQEHEGFRILVVGRISPVKDYETLIRAVARLLQEGKDISLTVVGGAGLPEQEAYLVKLKKLTEELGITDHVRFAGSVPNVRILEYLKNADCFANTSNTGSLDKAMAEAMATGLIVLSSNIAMREVLGEHSDALMFPPGDDIALAERLRTVMSMNATKRKELGERLRAIITEQHSLPRFVDTIISSIDAV